MTEEQWRPVVDWEGVYEVSDLGRVRSLDRIVVTKAGWSRPLRGRTLTPRPDDRGYPVVTLCRDNQPRTYFVHRLVALAFVGPNPPGQEVRHLDGNPANPVVTNLAYGTRSENGLDKRAHGTDHNRNKTHCPQGHEYTPENTYREPGRTNRRCKACRAVELRARRQALRAAS